MEFLSRKGVAYVEKNVRTDQSALEELIGHGINSTPAIMIDGRMYVGFEPKLLEEALAG